MNDSPIPIPTVTKRAFTVLHKDGRTPLAARIPAHLPIRTALPEIAGYAGYAPEPGVSTRYALLAGTDSDEGFTLLRDDQTFADVPEHSVLRIAPQPRPA
jgi:hypothetical protein